MGICTLHVGPRVLFAAEGTAPEAEYALFEEGDVELRATTPGCIREVAYRTTVERARLRLASFGIDATLAEQAARAFGGRLREVYARGPLARRLARHLGPVELFDGARLDGSGTYEGRWLDVAGLAGGTKLPRAGAALQALHWAALLSECDRDAPVALLTEDLTKDRRPGERTYKRPSLDQARLLPDALSAMSPAARTLPPFGSAASPSARDLLDNVRGRMTLAADAPTQQRLVRIERALSMREPPEKGPLASPDVWEVEVQLTMGDLTDVWARIEAVEAARGRLPATAYLRARAAFLSGEESAAVVAERASALVETITGFHELQLLAAQAWAEAGDLRRAAAYARDLAGDPTAPADLRAQADDLAVDASAGRRVSFVPPRSKRPSFPPGRLSLSPTSGPMPGRPSVPGTSVPGASVPGASVPGASVPGGARPAASRVPTAPVLPARVASPPRPQDSKAPDPKLQERTRPTFRPQAPDVPRRSSRPPVAPAGPEADEDGDRATHASYPPAAPSLGSRVALSAGTPVPPPPPAPPARPASAPPAGPPSISTLPSPAAAGTAVSLRPSAVGDVPPPARLPTFPSFDAELEGTEPPRESKSEAPDAGPPRERMRGASQPPIASLFPPPPIPQAAPLPRFEGPPEMAERLSLPPGLHGQPPPRDAMPTSFLDARVTFTHLARELARDYRLRYGIVLRTDAASLEHMQRHLRDRFPYHAVLTEDDALEVRRHGAFLSEVLARTLGAYWIDISAPELGYWAMAVPPGSRVLPFGRILRFIALGSKERDLVSFYVELQGRTGRR